MSMFSILIAFACDLITRVHIVYVVLIVCIAAITAAFTLSVFFRTTCSELNVPYYRQLLLMPLLTGQTAKINKNNYYKITF